jgi:hypothetical protein
MAEHVSCDGGNAWACWRPFYISFVLVALLAALTSFAYAAQYDVIGAAGLLDIDSNLDGVADGWYALSSGTASTSASMTRGGLTPDGSFETLSIRASRGQTGQIVLQFLMDVGPYRAIHSGDILTISVNLRASLMAGVSVIGVVRQEAQGVVLDRMSLMPEITSSVYDWTKYGAQWTVRPEATRVFLELYLIARTDCTTGKLAVDDVQVTRQVDQVPEPAPGALPMALFGKPQGDVVYAAKRFHVLQAGSTEALSYATFKMYAPNSVSLMYQMAFMVADAEYARNANEPISYNWIDQNHPEWFLHDASGQRIKLSPDALHVALDPGNRHYQDAWAEGAIRNARNAGVDGIKIDGPAPTWYWEKQPQEYHDAASYLAAADSFMHYVVRKIKRAGLVVVVNGINSTWASGTWSDWVQLIDGLEYEPVLDRALYETGDQWRGVLESYIKYPDKLYLQYLHDPTTYPASFRFDLASYLLWARPNSFVAVKCTAAGVEYHPLLDIRMGQALSETRSVTDDVFTREYEHGRVYLNISATTSQWVQIPPGLTDADTGQAVPEGPRLLAPHEPLILLEE